MPSSKDPVINRQKAREYALAHPEWKRTSNREWIAKDRAKNPEKYLELARQYRANLSDEKRAERNSNLREWRKRNPNYQKDYAEKNRGADPLRTILNQAKIRARERNLPYDLKRDNVALPEICPVLGIPIDYRAKGVFNPNSASIDRLVPALGYVASNCRVISNRANILKRDGTLAEFEAIVAYLRRELSG